MSGIKNDNEKSRVELIPSAPLLNLGKVLAVGAEKYGDHNWRKGMKWSKMYGAALRHIIAWHQGEERDAESKESHLAHAICCLLFLMEYEAQSLGTDDRPTTSGKKCKNNAC